MNKTQNELVSVLRSVIFGTELPEVSDWEKLYANAKRHEVAHIVAEVSDKYINVPADISELFQKASGVAVYSDIAQARELAEVCGIFEKNKTEAIVLKGVLLKKLYPSTNLRMMSDIDLLIHAEDEETVHKLLTENGYTSITYGKKKDNVYSKNGCVTLEVHKSFFVYEDKWAEAFESEDSVMNSFARSVPYEGFSYIRQMDSELFFVYMIAHLAKHLLSCGGIGIKSVLDIAVFLDRCELDKEITDRDLKSLGLLDFANNAVALSKSLFLNEQCNEKVIDDLAELIFFCGAYGNANVFIATNMKSKSGSKLGYLFKRAFPSRKSMEKRYPVLREKPYLLPGLYFSRLYKMTVKGKRSKKSVKNECEGILKTNGKDVRELRELYKRIGLNLEDE